MKLKMFMDAMQAIENDRKLTKEIVVSALEEANLTALLRRVEQAASYKWQVHTLSLRLDQLHLLGLFYEKSLVIDRKETPRGLTLTFMATEGNFKSLQHRLG